MITELRLDAFKSFRNATLPIADITFLTGRNSSGKSNALDGLDVLSRLAGGEVLADALDGRRRQAGMVRGGSRGCAPHGSHEFSLGCTVIHDGQDFSYSISVQVDPDLKIVEERLEGPAVAAKSGTMHKAVSIFQTRDASPDSPGIEVEIYSGKKGVNPARYFRDDRPILTQIANTLQGVNQTERSILTAIGIVISALRGTFHIDPVPHLMRAFVPVHDTTLRRTGENLSPALYQLQQRDLSSFDEIVDLTKKIADEQVVDISFAKSSLQDVMLQLEEKRGPITRLVKELTPAREMSDGLLRILAIATTLKSTRESLDIDNFIGVGRIDSPVSGGVLIVIEELENGLHPSQAHRILDLIQQSHHETSVRVLATTHSPALLDAAEGILNDSIIVCHRDPDTGYSRLTPLTQLPGYARALAEGTLGDAVTAGKLVDDVIESRDFSEFEKFLGVN
ncbi:AAA family ATPase [Corynebacterium gallinarum]|nr:ATP-binding protein [Corynebacterium gallinarum]